jgi:GPH family glycoside/pentoside/hexuronide:cation symporter
MLKNRPVWYALGNLGTNMFLQCFATFVLFFYVDHLHASLGLISLIMGIQAIWSAVLNPALGHLSDRTRSRFGRRIPYVAMGCLPLGLSFWMIWRPLVSRVDLPWYFAVVVTIFDAAYVAVTLNWTSLFPSMYRTLEDRAAVQAWRQGIGVVALMIGVALPPVLYQRFGWSLMGLGLAIVGTLGFVLSLVGSEEPAYSSQATAATPERRLSQSMVTAVRETVTNGSFLSFLVINFCIQFIFDLVPASLPFYGKYVMHIHGFALTGLLGAIFVVALLMMVPWAYGIRRMGSRRGMLFAILLLTLGLLPFWWLTGLAWGLIAAIILGTGLAGFLSIADILLAEVIDADARRQRLRREGSFFGINGFVVRFGVTAEAGVLYLILHTTGYHPNAAGHATALVQWGLRAAIGGVPLIALAIALIALRFFKAEGSPRRVNQSSQASSVSPDPGF